MMKIAIKKIVDSMKVIDTSTKKKRQQTWPFLPGRNKQTHTALNSPLGMSVST